MCERRTEFINAGRIFGSELHGQVQRAIVRTTGNKAALASWLPQDGALIELHPSFAFFFFKI